MAVCGKRNHPALERGMGRVSEIIQIHQIQSILGNSCSTNEVWQALDLLQCFRHEHEKPKLKEHLEKGDDEEHVPCHFPRHTERHQDHLVDEHLTAVKGARLDE